MKQITPGGFKHARADAVGLALAAALTAGAYFLQVQPLMQRNEARAAQRAELDSERRKLPDLKRSAQQVRLRLEKTQSAIEAMDLRLEPLNQLNQRLSRITEIATDNGLRLDEIEPGKAVANGTFEMINIRLAGQGGYQQCTRFLNSMHKQVPDTAAVSWELTGGDMGRPTEGAFSINLRWYTSITEPATKK